MPVQTALEKSKDLTKWLDHSVDGLQINTILRNSIAIGCFDTVHELRIAILLLLENHLIGASFSLVRPLFETFVRGEWALRCANDKELSDYEADKVETSVAAMIGRIEQLDPWDFGTLSQIKNSAWNAMCSYAHGGALQISRRFKGEFIAPNYNPDAIIEVINSSNILGLFSASEIASIANNPSLGNSVNEKLLELFPSKP